MLDKFATDAGPATTAASTPEAGSRAPKTGQGGARRNRAPSIDRASSGRRPAGDRKDVAPAQIELLLIGRLRPEPSGIISIISMA